MKIISKLNRTFLLLVVAVGALLTHSCSEEIDTSARYTFTGNTVLSYLQKHSDSYSEYCKLLDIVTISDYSQSTVSQLLSARGNYTCFAPTNEAIQDYLDSLVTLEVISVASWDAPEFQDEELLSKTRKNIVYNSLIDNGDDEQAYQTTDFSLAAAFSNGQGSNLTLANMKNRKLLVQKVSNDENSDYSIAGAKISNTNCDIFTINGYIHQVHDVIAPTDETVGDVFQKYIDDKVPGNYVFASLLDACNLLPELSKIEDDEYYRQRMIGNVKDLEAHPTFNSSPGYMPEHRYYGFSLFVESDEWWAEALGVANLYDLEPQEIVAKVSAYVLANNLHLPGATTGEDYTNENNALNQFVTYHIVPAKIEPNKLVIHYNELYYSVANQTKRTSVFDYYTTMGKRRLLKSFEPPMVSGDGRKDIIFLNRFPELRNGRKDNYSERRCDEDKQGVEILGSKELINAYIYDINGCLYFNQDVANNMGSERIRVDVSSVLKELMSNDIRANESTSDNRKRCVGMPQTKTYSYLEDCEIGSNTKFYYLTGRVANDGSTCWQNYQGDELNIVGNYEVTFKLPPVPKDGVYELRIGVSANSQRGMCQVYWGTDKEQLPAAGIPIDLRQGGKLWYNVFGSPGAGEASIVGWQDDVVDDDLLNADNDKKLRNNGYMKAPNSYWLWTKSATAVLADQHMRRMHTALRRIVLREEMKADQVYYIQFKSVLSNPKTEFYLDYFEFCEKSVYDNPLVPEDIW